MDILNFINTLRNSDRYIESIYMQGGCYQFHLVLKTIFPKATPYFNKRKNHVVTKINGIYYDIKGIYTGEVLPIIESDIKEIESWSFSRTMSLSLGECPVCEEPIKIKLEE